MRRVTTQKRHNFGETPPASNHTTIRNYSYSANVKRSRSLNSQFIKFYEKFGYHAQVADF